jgi:predicted GNAT superfamily acetyltransferase
MTTEIEIRPVDSISEYLACQDVQRAAWGISEEQYVIPVATMVAAQRYGGLVLGAFRPDQQLVGFSFAFLSVVRGRLSLYSQLTGVHPASQSQGIGTRLKHAQRRFARERAIDQIAWAFDPLKAGNAHFNLEVLGARAIDHVEDMYGPRSDALNRAARTNRLIAVWETNPRCDPLEKKHDRRTEAPLLQNLAERPFLQEDALASDQIRIELPASNPSGSPTPTTQADTWYVALNRAFRLAFDMHYEAIGFSRCGPHNSAAHYSLSRARPDSITI